MDTLVEFLTDKIGYTIFIILGFLLPGTLFIFVWNRQLYLEMEMVKLILLALAISFMLFAANFLCTTIVFMIQEKAKQKEETWRTILGFPIFVCDLEMSVAMIHKLDYPGYSISNFLNHTIIFLALMMISGIFSGLVYWIKRIKKTKKFK